MTADDQALVDSFLDMMAAEAGASRHTLAAYRNDLHRAADALGVSLSAAGPPDVARLGERWADLAPATVARRSAALRRFFGFLVDEGFRRDDPSGSLPRPRFERPLPRILDQAEVARMFEAAEDRAVSGEAGAVRNLALLELLYGSGLRATELVSLPRGCGSQGPGLPDRGRQGRQGAAGADFVARRGRGWTVARTCAAATACGCFPSGKNAPQPGAAVPAGAAWPPMPGSHPTGSARTCCATPSPPTCFGGRGLRVLQTLLGHADIATTQIYTHVDSARLVELVNARHPLATRRR